VGGKPPRKCSAVFESLASLERKNWNRGASKKRAVVNIINCLSGLLEDHMA